MTWLHTFTISFGAGQAVVPLDATKQRLMKETDIVICRIYEHSKLRLSIKQQQAKY